MKLRHIGITVTDIDKSLTLYRDIFNFKITWDQIEQGPFIDYLSGIENIKVRTVKLKDSSNNMIELLQYISHPEKNNFDMITRVGCSHFALTVNNIDKLYKQLIDFGLKFNHTPEISVDGNAKVAFCRDFDNVLIELVEEL